MYGHVNNARYLEFLEEARWCFLEDRIDLADWKARGIGFVVARITINYRRPAGLGATFLVETTLAHIGGRSGKFRQVVRIDGGEVAAEAEVVFVVIDTASGVPVPIEGAVRKAFGAWL